MGRIPWRLRKIPHERLKSAPPATDKTVISTLEDDA
jgi:hypothetical protein